MVSRNWIEGQGGSGLRIHFEKICLALFNTLLLLIFFLNNDMAHDNLLDLCVAFAGHVDYPHRVCIGNVVVTIS
jgi:hypothetical protein